MLKLFYNINLMNDVENKKYKISDGLIKSEKIIITYDNQSLNLNKSKVIDYIICLKLIIQKINIEMPNIFYEEWVSYLIPSFNIEYNNYNNIIMNANLFISAYNIKNKLIHLLNNEYYPISKKISYNNIDILNLSNKDSIIPKDYYMNENIIVNIKKDKILYGNKNIIVFEIHFYKCYLILNFKIKYFIDKFIFEIPLDVLKKILKYVSNKENSCLNTDIIKSQMFKKNTKNMILNRINYDHFNEIMTLIWSDNSTILMDDYVYSHILKKIVYYDLFKKVILRNINSLIN
jgi:hypothetical protein